jgi:hypothetical protein
MAAIILLIQEQAVSRRIGLRDVVISHPSTCLLCRAHIDRFERQIMFTSIIDWDGKQNMVVIMDGQNTVRVPLDDFIELSAVQYVIELQASETGRRRRAKRTRAADAPPG